MSALLNLLFIGDVVGDRNGGVEALEMQLSTLREHHMVDFCVVNGENAHEGRGINEDIVRRLYKAGADVITGGDHSFDKHLIFPYMAKDRNLLRPANYPDVAPGFGFGIYEVPGLYLSLAVINLRGQSFFHAPVDCPFAWVDKLLPSFSAETRFIFVDFHAEATAEKVTMGRFLDGRVSVVAGTHTHVQTADETIFPGGTGYISDVGMTGSANSIIGQDIDTNIKRFLTKMPQKFKLGEGQLQIQGALFSLDIETGKCRSVQRIRHFVY